MDAVTLMTLAEQGASRIAKNVAGLTHDDSLIPAPHDGNSANWILGHVVYWRNELLGLVGGERVWPAGRARQYRGTPGAPRPAAARFRPLPFRDLVAAMRRSHAAFADRLARPDTRLADTVGSRTVGATVLLLLCHEIYHAGQLGLMRRIVGKTGAH